MKKNNIQWYLMAAMLMVGIAFYACTSTESGENKEQVNPKTDKEELLDQIGELEQSLAKSRAITTQSKKTATDLLVLYKGYCANNPKDVQTPEFLFKAAEISLALGQFDQAINMYQRICMQHDDFDKAPESLYLTGFVYDAHLKQYGRAKEFYEKMMEKYPDHILAKDAEASLANLGLSDEELIKKFQEKEQAL